MASRMEIFITLSLYLAVSNILLSLTVIGIASARNELLPISTERFDTTSSIEVNDYRMNIEDTSYEFGDDNTLRRNARILWNIATIPFHILGGLGVFFMIIFIIVPNIFWWILLATFLLPTTNAGN